MFKRKATLEDIPQLKKAVYDYAEMLNSEQEIIDAEYVIEELLPALICNNQVVVLEEEGQVVATAAGVLQNSPFNPSVSFFVEMFWWVDSFYRSRGVGRKLLLAFEQMARNSGATYCTMNILHNTPHFGGVGSHLEKAGYKLQESIYSKQTGEM
jgi:GNAT superfamily N-acetyltransferase